MYMNQKCMWPVISFVLSKMKNFSRSQAVMYTVKMVISHKWCKTVSYYRPLAGSDCGIMNQAIYNNLE